MSNKNSASKRATEPAELLAEIHTMPDIRIPLDDDLHAKLKASAAVHRKSIKSLVIELIQAYIDQRKGLGR
jgi:plasmid stability protein